MNIFVAMLHSQKRLHVHYDNMPVNCNAIFCSCKNGDFQIKSLIKVVLANKYPEYMF